MAAYQCVEFGVRDAEVDEPGTEWVNETVGGLPAILRGCPSTRAAQKELQEPSRGVNVAETGGKTVVAETVRET